MFPSFTSFQGQLAGSVADKIYQGAALLKQLDNSPADCNPKTDALSVESSQGHLDAVILHNAQDRSDTMVQQLTPKYGQKTTTLLKVPQDSGSYGPIEGFEVTQDRQGGLSGSEMTGYFCRGSSGTDVTFTDFDTPQSQNSLFRAETVLASFASPKGASDQDWQLSPKG